MAVFVVEAGDEEDVESARADSCAEMVGESVGEGVDEDVDEGVVERRIMDPLSL